MQILNKILTNKAQYLHLKINTTWPNEIHIKKPITAIHLIISQSEKK